MTDAMTNQWVNKPQQARSRETMNRFILAAERLLREKPFDEITIGEIVEVAERTVGSFYARFDDKWALLRTLMHRYLYQIREFIDDLLTADEWADHGVREMVRVTAHATVGLYRAHGHIFRAGLAFSATDETARLEQAAHYQNMSQRMMRAVLEHPDVTSSDEVKARVGLALEAAGAVLDTRLLYSSDWHNGEADWEQVGRDIEDLFLSISGIA